ncbi:MAG: efflux RND transporter permease subunit [Saprospiraceae bacterium]|nr:efflux RND transporter permease subunit [Saprospiraceae bacterium]
MYISGFSINILTLLGIVLATGLVVDDAIVVLENIYQKIEEGMSPMQASFKGSNEIVFAIISTTVTLVVVFFTHHVPPGIEWQIISRIWRGGSRCSIDISFCFIDFDTDDERLSLKSGDHNAWFYRKTEPFFLGMNRIYERSLSGFMKFRWAAILIMIFSFGLLYSLGKELKSELAPLEDKSRFAINATTPEGTLNL